MAWGGGRRFPWSTLLSCLAPRCPFLGDNYRTQLVPVGPASSELPFPTHHQRFVLSTFAFVDSASQVALEGEVRRGPHVKRVRRGKSECRGRSSYLSQVLTSSASAEALHMQNQTDSCGSASCLLPALASRSLTPFSLVWILGVHLL